MLICVNCIFYCLRAIYFFQKINKFIYDHAKREYIDSLIIYELVITDQLNLIVQLKMVKLIH